MPITCPDGEKARYRFKPISGGRKERLAFCGNKVVEVSIFKNKKKIKTKKLKGWFGDSIGHSNARRGMRKRYRLEFVAFKGTEYADSGHEKFVYAKNLNSAIRKSGLSPSAIYKVESV